MDTLGTIDKGLENEATTRKPLILKQGTYLDTPEKHYREWPAINYSALADFNESQDHALMKKEAKSYFEEGTAFELLIEDQAKGSDKFGDRFFLSDAPGNMPEELAGWINRNESLNDKYRLTKSGDRNKQSDRLHSWLDSCRANPGKMPVGIDQKEMLDKMVKNFMAMQPFSDGGNSAPMAEILPAADFQIPIVWYNGKQRKKALIDVYLETDLRIYAFDIKTTADMKRFDWMLKDKYWIQEVHYTDGLSAVFPDKEIVWRFVVASKAEPYLSQPYTVDPYSLEKGRERYFNLCDDYQEWTDDGRPPKGWKELKTVSIFFD